MVRTRFAPSPTGDLHVGGAWTALASWAFARAAGGTTVLRIEDIDTPRVVHESHARIAEDLAWLGLSWDEGAARTGLHAPYTQSARTTIYAERLDYLERAGLTYRCDCSRADIARVASAPHHAEESVYPGTCRDARQDRPMKRSPAIRLRVPEGTTVAVDDLVHGISEQRVDMSVGDFVIRRGDGVYAYQFVVAIDDAAMRISHVIRGDDLRASTARQIQLMRVLGTTEAEIPRYAHVPMVVAQRGERLAKRIGSVTLRDLRARGVTPAEIVRTLADGLGLSYAANASSPNDVAANLNPPSLWRKAEWPIPDRWR